MTDYCSNNLINPDWAKHGYIQVYTGNGKGKTTASLGLAMRALGRCWKVLIIMFMKGGDDYGELNSFRNLSPEIARNLTIIQAGPDRIVYQNNKTDEDTELIKKGWELAKKAIKNIKKWHDLSEKGGGRLTQKEMRNSLVKQLELRGMNADFYMDMVNDYVYYWSLKKKLIADIRKKGLRYETINGNGVHVEKANESVVNLQKTTATMLKILSDLKLKEPVPEQENPSDGYL